MFMEGDIILLRQNKRTLSLREYFTTPQKDLQMPTFTLGTLGLKQPAQGKLKLYSFAPFRKQNGQEKRILTILSKLVFLLQELPSLSETKTRQVVGNENCFNCYFQVVLCQSRDQRSAHRYLVKVLSFPARACF